MESIVHISELLLLFMIWLSSLAALSQSPECLSQTCGTLRVRYPFKLQSEPNCPSFSPFFDLECIGEDLFLHNFTFNGTDWPLKVLQIQSDSLIVDATDLKAVMGTSTNGTCSVEGMTSLVLPVFPGPFVFADDNRFGSFGCSMGILIGAALVQNTSSSEASLSNVELGGCSVLCPDNEKNQECSNGTCCVSDLVRGTLFRAFVYVVDPSPFKPPENEQLNSVPCNDNYAMVFDPNYTDFSNYGLKITWALSSNQTNSTDEIQKSIDFACSDHSNITIVQEIPGYRCSCQQGFDGDGYLHGLGCLDIDECTNASLNECIPGTSTCQNNVEGKYTCKCNTRYYVGDGMKNGSGCKLSPTLKNAVSIIGAIVFLGLLITGLIVFAIYYKKKVKSKYFLLNGGVELQHIISQARGSQEVSSRLFTAEELKVATENYAEHMKLGMGGFGTVYKGVLPDSRLVAIKKANKAGHAEAGTNEFLNEMRILMQINHRNIVRLLGCCMETAVPLLVYEFVGHGNVRENLDSGDPGFTNWAQRLKVARQTAEALAYLHAAASPPILHRDVKSANVLLDDNLDIKVADFGASRLVSAGMHHVSTGVQGTIGYLDPEYFQTLQLTDKSDVYSLGVMLLELITGLKPIDSQSREPGLANLALLFINYMQEDRGEELIDRRLEELATIPSGKSWDLSAVRSSIMAVADLALRCLALRGADRPSMNFVADELRYITRSLEQGDNELDASENSPLMPRKPKPSKHYEGGAVLKQDADFFVQSAYSGLSINDLQVALPPR